MKDRVQQATELRRSPLDKCVHVSERGFRRPGFCQRNCECWHCAYEQMLDEAGLRELTQAPKLNQASGYWMAQDYYYHMGHCWTRFDHSGRVMVGFDDFLVKVFGALQSVELPHLGAKLVQNQVGWSFGRGEHSAKT